MTVAPVSTARSWSTASRRSPKAGAFTAIAVKVPRARLTTRVASASAWTSSATISSGRPARMTSSRLGSRSATAEILASVTRTRASDSTDSMFCRSVTRCAEMYPRSNCMPSTTSTSVSMPVPSSTETTPSFPTLSKASEIMAPITGSPELIVATRRMSSPPLTGCDRARIDSTAASQAAIMPSRNSLGGAPAARFRKPSSSITRASTVAVVVPSPAMSLVLIATSLSSCAPMFSK